MTQAKKHIIDAIRQTAWQVAPNATKVLLFGSQARGDAREDSDWDILVLLNKERVSLDDIDNVAYPLRELGWELGADINTILYTVDDWHKSSFTPFYKNVVKDSIEL